MGALNEEVTDLFFFGLMMIGQQKIERCHSEASCQPIQPMHRSQVSDPGG